MPIELFRVLCSEIIVIYCNQSRVQRVGISLIQQIFKIISARILFVINRTVIITNNKNYSLKFIQPPNHDFDWMYSFIKIHIKIKTKHGVIFKL